MSTAVIVGLIANIFGSVIKGLTMGFFGYIGVKLAVRAFGPLKISDQSGAEDTFD